MEVVGNFILIIFLASILLFICWVMLPFVVMGVSREIRHLRNDVKAQTRVLQDMRDRLETESQRIPHA